MAFVNRSPSRRLVQTSGPNSVYSRVGNISNTVDFINSFGGTVRPTSLISLSPNIDFNFNVGSTSKDGDPPKTNSPKSKPKSGNRPHKAWAYRPMGDRSSVDITFKSNIESGLLIDPMEDNTKRYSTLFVMAGSFFSGNTENSISKKLMNDLLFQDILNQCQTKVNYRVDSDITSEKFYKYISSITSAIQLYYYVDSILTYCKNDDIPVKNVGMQYLRSQLTADILSQHVLLGEKLLSYALPPNILNLVRYMYQNFNLVDDVQSPIVRLSFRETIHEGSHIKLSPEYYDVILEEIRSVGSRVSNILRNSFPEMNFSSMPLSSSYPIYDKNFLTFWVNGSVTYLSSSGEKVSHSRSVKNKNQDFNYFTYYGKDHDGIFLSCNSIYDSYLEAYYSGIWTPISDVAKFKGFPIDSRSSLLCYDSIEMRLTSPKSIESLSQSGLYHGIYYDEDLAKYTDCLMAPMGSLKYQSCSLKMMDQAISLSIYYLFGLSHNGRK